MHKGKSSHHQDNKSINIKEAALVRGSSYFEYEDYEIPIR
jgi:hypothetical protein